MISLLDVNVLIALGDADHPDSSDALAFFETDAMVQGWASCPLTENAFLRILAWDGYPGGPGSTTIARQILRSILEKPGHQFWPDDISLINNSSVSNLPSAKRLTDVYLLALAVKNGARFVTFDQHVDPSLVQGGEKALWQLGD